MCGSASVVCLNHHCSGCVGEGAQQQGKSVVAMSLCVCLKHHLEKTHIKQQEKLLKCDFTQL